MASSSSSNNNGVARVVLASFLSTQLLSPVQAVDPARPFPVLGTVTVSEGHWNDVPDFMLRLEEGVIAEPIKFELEAAAGEQYFRLNLLEESRRSFQRLLKAKKPS